MGGWRGGNYSIAAIPVNNLNGSLGLFTVGAYPNNVAFSPDDAVMYAEESAADRIKYFDASTFQLLGSFPVARAFRRLVVDRSGKYLFAAEKVSYSGPPATLRVYDTGREATVITSNLTQNAGQNVPFTYQITASNSPTSFNAEGLPLGLRLDTATGLISGTPLEIGVFSIQLSATNAIGTAMATLTLEVGHALTVTIGGQGSVSAGYLGTTYRPAGTEISITATPLAGHVFVGWTGSIESNANPLNFSLSGPTSLQANFAQLPPVLTSPTQTVGKVGSPLSYTITAGDNPESFEAVELPSGLSLNPATGVITGTPQVAGSFDVLMGATNSGGTGQRAVRFVIDARLDVTASSGGSVSPKGITYHPAQASVTVTATPQVGYAFQGWTGSLASNSRKLTFSMLSQVQLRANFVPWSLYSGSYSGLVAQETPTNGHSGLLTAEVTKTGQFSGSILLDGVKYPLKGVFGPDNSASLTIARKKLPPLLVSLFLDASGTLPQITGSVQEGSEWSARLVGRRATADALAQAGNYTLALDHERQDLSLPGGVGYGTLTITSVGSARLKGVLGDGTKVTASAVLASDGSLAFHAPLYQKKGFISGTLYLSESGPATEMDGGVHWFKPATKGRYADGFSLSLAAAGSRYVAPPALAGDSGALAFEQGGLGEGFSESFTLNSAGKLMLSQTNSRAVACKLNVKTGLFSGKFKDAKKTRKFGGVIVQGQNLGAGTFVGDDATGAVDLTIEAPLHSASRQTH